MLLRTTENERHTQQVNKLVATWSAQVRCLPDWPAATRVSPASGTITAHLLCHFVRNEIRRCHRVFVFIAASTPRWVVDVGGAGTSSVDRFRCVSLDTDNLCSSADSPIADDFSIVLYNVTRAKYMNFNSNYISIAKHTTVTAAAYKLPLSLSLSPSRHECLVNISRRLLCNLIYFCVNNCLLL